MLPEAGSGAMLPNLPPLWRKLTPPHQIHIMVDTWRKGRRGVARSPSLLE